MTSGKDNTKYNFSGVAYEARDEEAKKAEEELKEEMTKKECEEEKKRGRRA